MGIFFYGSFLMMVKVNVIVGFMWVFVNDYYMLINLIKCGLIWVREFSKWVIVFKLNKFWNNFFFGLISLES